MWSLSGYFIATEITKPNIFQLLQLFKMESWWGSWELEGTGGEFLAGVIVPFADLPVWDTLESPPTQPVIVCPCAHSTFPAAVEG